MRTILLARVSTYEQETIQQITKLKEYINSKSGLTLKDEDIFDFDESAHQDVAQRKKFTEVLDKIFSAKERIVVCSDKIDRMVRDFLTFLPVIDKLRKIDKLELHFPGDNLILTNESPAGDLFRFNMGVALAQYYSDTISDAVRRKIAQNMREGKILTKAPFGYENITLKDGSKDVIIDPYKAEIVLKVFQLYATGTYSYLDIKKKIYKDYHVSLGINDSNGKSSIGNILTNKFYIGIATYKKKGIEYLHKYETIVPTYLFKTVTEVREAKNLKMKNGRVSTKSFYYSNLMKCSICGYTVSAEEHRGKTSYRCTQYGGKHDAKYIQENELDKQFKEAFRKLTLPEDKAKRVMEDLKVMNNTSIYIAEGTIEKLNQRKIELRGMKSKLYDDYAMGKTGITDDFYVEKSKQYDNEVEDINEKIKKVERVEKDFYITAGYIVQLTKHSAELFERSEPEERRILINTVLLNIKWDGEKLSYDYNSPFDLLVELNESPSWGG